MSKWSWIAMAALLAVLGSSYYLLSRSNSGVGLRSPNSGIDIESFDTSEEGDGEGSDKDDNTYDILDDPDAGPTVAGKMAPPGRAPVRNGTSGVETIDDDDERGETVRDPVVIEDNDESIEAAKP